MVPKFDGAKWVPSKDDEGPEAGYSKVQTLLMHGPKPWFNRVFQEEEYEQAVLKFMAGDKVGRVEAMGNMDAYLRNPNDWAYNRGEEARLNKKFDYWTLRKDVLVLTLIWSSIVAFFGYRVFLLVTTGESIYSFLTPYLHK